MAGREWPTEVTSRTEQGNLQGRGGHAALESPNAMTFPPNWNVIKFQDSLLLPLSRWVNSSMRGMAGAGAEQRRLPLQAWSWHPVGWSSNWLNGHPFSTNTYSLIEWVSLCSPREQWGPLPQFRSQPCATLHHQLFMWLRKTLALVVPVCTQTLSYLQLFVTPWTVTRQAPLSMEFSRQEYCSGLPFPSSGHFPHLVIKPMSFALAGDFFTTAPLMKSLVLG